MALGRGDYAREERGDDDAKAKHDSRARAQAQHLGLGRWRGVKT